MLIFIFSRWEDPRSIALTTEGRISARGEKLVLTNAQQSDSGNYTCVAYNMAGETSHKVPIVVSGKHTTISYTLVEDDHSKSMAIIHKVLSNFIAILVMWSKITSDTYMIKNM